MLNDGNNGNNVDNIIDSLNECNILSYKIKAKRDKNNNISHYVKINDNGEEERLGVDNTVTKNCNGTFYKDDLTCNDYFRKCVEKQDDKGIIECIKFLNDKNESFDEEYKKQINNLHPSIVIQTLKGFGYVANKNEENMIEVESVRSWLERKVKPIDDGKIYNNIIKNKNLLTYLNCLVEYLNKNPEILNSSSNKDKLEISKDKYEMDPRDEERRFAKKDRYLTKDNQDKGYKIERLLSKYQRNQPVNPSLQNPFLQNIFSLQNQLSSSSQLGLVPIIGGNMVKDGKLSLMYENDVVNNLDKLNMTGGYKYIYQKHEEVFKNILNKVRSSGQNISNQQIMNIENNINKLKK
jgi:hypothetical protein